MMKRLSCIGILVAAALLGDLALFSTTRQVATAGTPVILSVSPLSVASGTIQASDSNTGTICVGGANVSCSAGIGLRLKAHEATPLLAIPGAPHNLQSI